MARTDDTAGAARVRAQREAAAARRAHIERQRAARWRVVLVDDAWRVLVNRGAGWLEAAAPLPGFSDVGDTAERRRMGAWLRNDVLDVPSLILDRDYDAEAAGRVAYWIKVNPPRPAPPPRGPAPRGPGP